MKPSIKDIHKAIDVLQAQDVKGPFMADFHDDVLDDMRNKGLIHTENGEAYIDTEKGKVKLVRAMR